MLFNNIKDKPVTIGNVHESCYRSFSILESVKEMIKRGDSIETIKEYIEYMEKEQELPPLLPKGMSLHVW